MVEYSFNRKRDGLVFASMKDINASFKDLCAVCDAIRYKSAHGALSTLDSVASGMPILYRRHNAHMGARHEIGGRTGRYPKKCAAIVRKVLVNAMANAENKGDDPHSMYIVHATANKTMILQRTAPKGVLWLGHSMGRRSARRADVEFARVELALGYGEEEGLSSRMKAAITKEKKRFKEMPAQKVKEVKPAKQKKQKAEAKQEAQKAKA
ncbi:MAG: hypothetical protein M1160_02385 [Candidatus Marsarchaeota archaeon]|jgi:large subunit ribosomal protein L22|nr:hypothetical protein [Candidatus Marsarchaeota archaeon]MCL5111706.1 hypothetical protein [Candidatus Marsarchaeota archaeon]